MNRRIADGPGAVRAVSINPGDLVALGSEQVEEASLAGQVQGADGDDLAEARAVPQFEI